MLTMGLMACGGGTKAPATVADAAIEEDDAVDEPIKTRPRDSAPPALSAKEKSDLAGRCAAIEPVLYDAHKQAELALDSALANGTANDAADEAALAAAMGHAKDRPEGLDDTAHARCLELFRKAERKRIFDHEPAVADARITIDSCVRRAVASFGKERMAFDMGNESAGASQSPFCPDDDPVPMSLNDLPYKSTKDDWDTPTWRCLQFGLRTKQHFQLAYISDPSSNRFDCVARIMPRHGGPPLELSRGGKVNEEGELIVSRKLRTEKMKTN
jgi:hypothetical protein